MSTVGEDRPDVSGILAHLWQLIESVMDEAEPAMETLGLSMKAFYLLEAVVEHPFPAELARRMHLPPPTVTYLIKQLEGKGYLERRAEPGDLRKFRLVRTPSGDRAIEEGRSSLGQVFGDRLKRLDPSELAAFDRSVRRLTEKRTDEG